MGQMAKETPRLLQEGEGVGGWKQTGLQVWGRLRGHVHSSVARGLLFHITSRLPEPLHPRCHHGFQ